MLDEACPLVAGAPAPSDVNAFPSVWTQSVKLVQPRRSDVAGERVGSGYQARGSGQCTVPVAHRKHGEDATEDALPGSALQAVSHR